MKITNCIVLVALLFSCSNLSQNVVKEDELVFTGGVYQEDSWKDEMQFKRISWYKEISLVYDVLFYKVDPTSKFYVWFSTSEKELVTSCEKFLVSIAYNLPGSGITHRIFKNEMLSNGYINYSIPNFVTNLKGHPDFTKWTLQSYKVEGYCLSKKLGTDIDINLPGYKQVRIKI